MGSRNDRDTVFCTSLYKGFYECSPDMYRTIDFDGNIIACNQAYAKNLNYSRSEIIGKSIFDHTAEKSQKIMRDTYERWKSTGKVSNSEIWLKRKNGETFPVLLSVNNLYDSNNKLIGSNTVLRDISEFYDGKNESDFIKFAKLATVGELSAHMAHDMRNPLTAIQNSIELIKNEENLSDISLRMCDVAQRAVDRMAHQIENVLDFVKEKPMKILQLDLLETIGLSVNTIKIPSKIKINIPNKHVIMYFDPEHLRIVFTNLLLNSIQAIGAEGTIDITVKEQDDSVLIEISDTGVGIPDDVLPKVFDVLFTTKLRGTGLGLSSVKTIVENHCGTIQVRNNPTTFSIILPKTH